MATDGNAYDDGHDDDDGDDDDDDDDDFCSYNDKPGRRAQTVMQATAATCRGVSGTLPWSGVDKADLLARHSMERTALSDTVAGRNQAP